MKKNTATKSTPLLTVCFVLFGTCHSASYSQPIVKPNDALAVGAGRGFINPIQDKTATPERQGFASSSAQEVEKGNIPMMGQPPKLSPVAAMPPSKTPIDTDSAINPLTGKSFSEERLARLLNANKLLTDIYRQQVSQAQLQTELELTGDRRQAESARLRSDAINIIPKPIVPTKESLKPGEELMPNIGRRTSVSDQTKTVVAPISISSTPPSLPQQASGTLKIGSETIQAQSSYLGPQSKVVYVDAQPIVQRNNTPSSSTNSFPQILNSAPNLMNTGGGQLAPNFIPSPISR